MASTTRSAAEIEGFASSTSVAPLEKIQFFVNVLRPTLYTIEIYRIGWYGGLGGRLHLGPIVRAGVPQPPCELADSKMFLVECRWADPLTITIPVGWVSGFYLAKLTDNQTRRQSYIIFVVRDEQRTAAHLFVSAVTTYQAYNVYGGFSLYKGQRNAAGVWRGPASMLSFDRPYNLAFFRDFHDPPFDRSPGFDPFWRPALCPTDCRGSPRSRSTEGPTHRRLHSCRLASSATSDPCSIRGCAAPRTQGCEADGPSVSSRVETHPTP